MTASLKNNYPTLDWGQIADYNLERMASHGDRRAAEMEESAATLRELGLDPLMAQSTVARQPLSFSSGSSAASSSPGGSAAGENLWN